MKRAVFDHGAAAGAQAAAAAGGLGRYRLRRGKGPAAFGASPAACAGAVEVGGAARYGAGAVAAGGPVGPGLANRQDCAQKPLWSAQYWGVRPWSSPYRSPS